METLGTYCKIALQRDFTDLFAHQIWKRPCCAPAMMNILRKNSPTQIHFEKFFIDVGAVYDFLFWNISSALYEGVVH